MSKLFTALIVSLTAITAFNYYMIGYLSEPDVSIEYCNMQDKVLLVQDFLRKKHPNADDGCIIVASYIQVGRYKDIEHMMQPFGRCATEIVGLRVDPQEYRYK